ncbi:MAG: protein tyrosine phosphatase, partial [Isosphaeraceae bacterium]
MLLVAMFPAFWHVLVFPSEIDGEYPEVVRPTFSRRPPPAYRLAEPGDTIDRVAIYVSAVAIALSLGGLIWNRSDRRLWTGALAIGTGAYWLAANPSPTFDGWHGIGWASIGNAQTPWMTRVALVALGFLLVSGCAWAVGTTRDRWASLLARARANQVAGLLASAAVLAMGRAFDIPGVEPQGYWPRWFLVWALILFAAALIRLMPRPRLGPVRRLASFAVAAGIWYVLVAGGIWLTWYHRPLARLREIVPGKVYISAMPTGKGLEIAQARHHFKTIINLFPESGPLRSPRLPEELAFVQKHGLTYVGS